MRQRLKRSGKQFITATAKYQRVATAPYTYMAVPVQIGKMACTPIYSPPMAGHRLALTCVLVRWSSSLPGVATIMFTPLIKRSASVRRLAPPMIRPCVWLWCFIRSRATP